MIQIPFHCCAFAVELTNWWYGHGQTPQCPQLHPRQQYINAQRVQLFWKKPQITLWEFSKQMVIDWWIVAYEKRSIDRSIRAVLQNINDRIDKHHNIKFIDWFVCCWLADCCFFDFLKLHTFRIFDLYKCICIGISYCWILCALYNVHVKWDRSQRSGNWRFFSRSVFLLLLLLNSALFLFLLQPHR